MRARCQKRPEMRSYGTSNHIWRRYHSGFQQLEQRQWINIAVLICRGGARIQSCPIRNKSAHETKNVCNISCRHYVERNVMCKHGWRDMEMKSILSDNTILEPCRCMCANECARKYACEDVLFTPLRRLQWIAVGCKRNLQQRQRTLYKKYCRCTSYKSFRTFKSGVHLFVALENSLKCLVWVSQCRSSNLPRHWFPVLEPPFLLHTLWSILLERKFELIVRVSLHDGGLPRWFSLCTGT